jgi:hypothetical protein
MVSKAAVHCASEIEFPKRVAAQEERENNAHAKRDRRPCSS